jgi:hypothetical protein
LKPNFDLGLGNKISIDDKTGVTDLSELQTCQERADTMSKATFHNEIKNLIRVQINFTKTLVDHLSYA